MGRIEGEVGRMGVSSVEVGVSSLFPGCKEVLFLSVNSLGVSERTSSMLVDGNTCQSMSCSMKHFKLTVVTVANRQGEVSAM